MPCFTSQLTNLRPNFVRPLVPRQSDHVIRHMVRCNTEAYANIEATYHSSRISRHLAVSRPVEHIKYKNEHKMRAKTCKYCQIQENNNSIELASPMVSTYGSTHYCLELFVNNPPTWIPKWTYEDTFEPPLDMHHEDGKIDTGACGSLCKASHMHYMCGRLSLALWSSPLGHGQSPCRV